MSETNRDGVPLCFVRRHESEGCKQRRAEYAALRRKVASVRRMGVDSFMGTLSTMAGLTPREHAVVFSWLWRRAKGERATDAALARQFHCSRPAIHKSHQKAKDKLDAALGHEVKPPQYDGFDRYEDLEIVFDTRALRRYTAGRDDDDRAAVERAESALAGDAGGGSVAEGLQHPFG